MKTTLFSLILALSCGFMVSGNDASEAPNQSSTAPSLPKKLTGRLSNIIAIENEAVKSFDDLEKIQVKTIEDKHTGYRILFSLYVLDKNREIQVVTCIKDDMNKPISFNFDVTDAFKKLKMLDEETKLKIEKIQKQMIVFN